MHNHFNYFFIAGSPFYSGCLYNALDTELDKFTNCFIQSWVDESQKLENNIKLDPKGESTDLRNELIKMQELIIKTRFKAINYLSQQVSNKEERRKLFNFPYMSGTCIAFYGLPICLFK